MKPALFLCISNQRQEGEDLHERTGTAVGEAERRICKEFRSVCYIPGFGARENDKRGVKAVTKEWKPFISMVKRLGLG